MGAKERWEYLCCTLQANVDNPGAEDYLNEGRWNRYGLHALGKFSPEWLIPELDRLGADGWELVQLQPVYLLGAQNGEIQLVPQSEAMNHTHTFLCVFKRKITE